MLYHTSPNGVVALVLSNGSLSTETSGEDIIRKNIIEADLLEAIVALPSQLFSNTQIPACILILNKNKPQKGQTLFIDARDFGYMLDRKQKAFSDKDVEYIADVFHSWRSGTNYEDVNGKFYSATIEEIKKQDYILTPGRYVGIVEEEGDGIPFNEKMSRLTEALSEQFEENAKLEEQIKKNFNEIGYHV